MRTPLLLAAALLLTAPLPAAQAAHYGPCTHEYFEILVFIVVEGDPATGAQYLGNCVTGNVYWVCRITRCDTITIHVPPLPDTE